MKKQLGLSAMPVNKAFQMARVNLPNQVQTLYSPLYDYQQKTAAATQVQRFFSTPNGSNGKTEADTNLTLNGQLPKGQAFVVTGVQVEYFPDIDINTEAAESQYADDILKFYSSGYLDFKIGSASYVQQGNLMKFPPINRLAIASGSATQKLYGVATGREYNTINLLLESSQDFSVELRDLAATSTTGKIGVTLNGILYRNAQG